MLQTRSWFSLLFLLCSLFWLCAATADDAVSTSDTSAAATVPTAAPAPAAPVAASAPAVTSAQAGQVLDILRDEKKRAELEQALTVIEQVGGTGTAAAAPASTRPAPAATPAPAPAAPAPAPASAASDLPIALDQDSVIARTFAQASHWLRSMAAEMKRSTHAMLELRSAGAWWSRYLGTPTARAESFESSWKLLLILVVAWAVESLFQLGLRRPRAMVAVQAAHRHELAQAPPPEIDDDQPTSSPNPKDARNRNLTILRRVPYALSDAVLNLLPLAGFLLVTTALTTVLGGDDEGFYRFLVPLVGAYAGARVTLAALRLLISPQGAGLRLTRIGDSTAQYLTTWLRRIVILMAAGYALGEIATLLGASHDAHNALSKLVGLVVHLMLLVMAVQSRQAVARWIRGPKPTRGMRNIMADAWLPVAVACITGLWVVWALGIADGFAQLLRYLWRTGLVILVATVLSILLLGFLDRVFDAGQPDADPANPPHRRPYHAVTQRIISIAIMIGAVIVLLQVWGLHAFDWFRPGTLGRQLASAAGTIAVVCALALIAWEAINLSIGRRMDRWAKAGDMARAARLRTLVPILRTTLLVVIGLIVLLTALNELGINIAPLLAGASIIGVALGFGSQKLVQDFITGIFLLMENAMQVGDYVTLAGVSGTVENLSIRTVRLRASDGALHVVPFSSVGTVSNTNRGLGNAAVKVVVAADSDLDLVIATVRQIGAEMRADPKIGPLMLADLELWGVDQVDGAQLTLLGQIRSLDTGRWSVQREFNQRIYRRFRELGIRLSNPQASFVSRLDAQPAQGEDNPGPGPAGEPPAQGHPAPVPSAAG